MSIGLLLVAHGNLVSAAPAPRSFQMSVWDRYAAADADLPWLYEGSEQPPGPAILQLAFWKTATVTSLLNLGFDWTRIVAVVIDEPYWGAAESPSWVNPCSTSTDGRLEKIAAAASIIQGVAHSVETVSKSTRFWINFSEPELQWMMGKELGGNCSLTFIHSYIDVVSMDKYGKPFSKGRNRIKAGIEGASVKPYYDWLAKRRSPQQQLAVVIGTFYRVGHDDPDVIASYLPGFFEYARKKNKRCKPAPDEAHIVGGFDRCPVWAAVGWTHVNSLQGGVQYIGLGDPTSKAIADAWRKQFDLGLNERP